VLYQSNCCAWSRVVRCGGEGGPLERSDPSARILVLTNIDQEKGVREYSRYSAGNIIGRAIETDNRRGCRARVAWVAARNHTAAMVLSCRPIT